jgi:hypothetical protein
MQDVLLGLLIVLQAVIGYVMIARTSRDSRESLQALTQGQEHIAALAAEVLRRTPEGPTHSSCHPA